MTLKNVKDIVVGIIKQSFTNKKTLDKFDDSSGVLMYNGSELGTKINISEEENNAVVLKDDNSLFVEDKTEELQNLTDNFNTIKKYQKYENIELDSCHCILETDYTPIVDEYVPFIKKSGSFEINEGKVILKPGQRVQINIVVSYLDTSNSQYANITYAIKDYTNNIEIFAFRPINNDANLEYSDTVFCQYTNETSANCEIGLYVSKVKTSDTLRTLYTSLTIQEIGRQIVIDPVEHVNTEQGLEDTPVGHIISHMGTVAPKHYLICDGAEYNIADYSHLAQHI
jgi:hypothetical protein